MSHRPNYEQVELFLRTYSSATGQYDVNGLLQLVLAGIDNLREHALAQEIEDFACSISDDQAAFIQRLLDSRAMPSNT